ncbi:MAG: hypothetical protein WBB27_17745 [Maribacter sp.]
MSIDAPIELGYEIGMMSVAWQFFHEEMEEEIKGTFSFTRKFNVLVQVARTAACNSEQY